MLVYARYVKAYRGNFVCMYIYTDIPFLRGCFDESLHSEDWDQGLSVWG